MSTAVGFDLVEVDDVRESIRMFGDRYLQRVYTEAELRDCDGRPRRLAARFAAKEAAMKALGCADRLPWHSIAVVDEELGGPILQLAGAAAQAARARGLRSIKVDLTHGASHAAAIVLMEAT